MILRENGSIQNNPAPDTGLRPGDQIGPDGLVTPQLAVTTPDCPKGFYYHEKYERCVERDPGGCPVGYFLDPQTERCVPTNGPSSPCPLGFVYDPKTECCVPEPGTDGTRCPDDEETPIGTPDLTQGFQPFETTNFDPNSGECEDDGKHGDGMPCPIGDLCHKCRGVRPVPT